MFSAAKKIVYLNEYSNTRDLLRHGKIETALKDELAKLSDFEEKALILLTAQHSLKQTRQLKRVALKNELVLTMISHSLANQLRNTAGEQEKEKTKVLQEECKELFVILDRVKKNINDDLVDRRYAVLTPITKIGFLSAAPITAATIARIFTEKTSTIEHVAVAGEGIALAITFRDEAKTVVKRVKKAILNTPRAVRNSTAGSALRIFVAAKQVSEIQPKQATRALMNNGPTVTAKL